MAFQSVPECAQIDIIMTLNGVTVQNSFYARLPSGYNLVDLQNLADAVDLMWASTWRADQPSEVTYLRTEVKGLEFENDQVATQNLSTAAGTASSQALPNQVTFAIKKSSGLTGRSARGRCYWVGIPEGEIQASNENLIKTAFAAILVANVDQVRLTIATVGIWEPVLVSRFLNKVKRATGVFFGWTSTSNVDERVDTMRDRLPA